MLLQLATWPEVETYLAGNRAIIMPIGSTEQHGPNGMIGTDAITAEAVARAAGEAAGAMVGPTIAVGMAQHHMAFPGSMTLRPSTLIAVLRDCVLSLAKHGFERFYFVNGHGGNIATVSAAFSEIHAEASLARDGNAPGLKLALRNWWEGAAVKALSQELFGAAEGGHATPSEVSVTWFLHPEAAKPMTLDPPIAPRGGFGDAADYRRKFPDGRIGSNPGLATVEAGRRIYDAAVEAVIADFRRFAAKAD
ncbi:MAG: creatininase family protein [Rhodospirillaceae bacterium]|nr:creatininase family protein [Rhodospirillaceae bacterium]